MKKKLSDIANNLLFKSLELRDKNAMFSSQAFREIGALGFFKRDLTKSEELHDVCEDIIELTAEGLDIPFSLTLVAHYIGLEAIRRYGSDELMEKIESFEWKNGPIAVCNSEITGGTDLKEMESEVIQEGEETFLNAHKFCISNLPQADFAIISAKDCRDNSHFLKSVFIDLRDSEKESLVDHLDGFRTGLTGNVKIDKRKITESMILNRSGHASLVLKTMFNLERFLIPFIFIGIHKRLVADAINFANNKYTFGKAIITNQYIQDKILALHENKLILESIGWRLFDLGAKGSWRDIDSDLSIFKFRAVEMTMKSTQIYTELLGGKSYMTKEYISKVSRDVRAFMNIGGTKELHKMKSINAILASYQKEEINNREAKPTERTREPEFIRYKNQKLQRQTSGGF